MSTIGFTALGFAAVTILILGFLRSRLRASTPPIHIAESTFAPASGPTQKELELEVEIRTRELFAANLRLETIAAELKQARREADAQREQAIRASNAKSAFLATLSHELRTPLNAILGFSEVIESEIFGAIENRRYRDYVHDIHEAAAHLQDMINDILDLSKIEANKYELDPEWVDLADLMQDPLRMMRGRAIQGGVQLVEDFDSVAPILYVDARATKQMTLNLVSNAIKFTPAGGSVTLRTRLLSSGEVAVEVEDTGCGIAEQNFDRILQPFMQVENSLNRHHRGTGLGLPLVNALIGLHGGSLGIASEVGKGTRMSLYFPAERVTLNRTLVAQPVEMCA